MQIRIGSRVVSRDGPPPPLVMAEIGVNHDGSVEKGLALVEAAAWAKCHAVKFQLFETRRLISRDAELVAYQKKVDGGPADAEDLLSHLEMPAEKMEVLVRRAKELGMAVVITPFSAELVDACAQIGADAIKIASPDLVNKPLLERAAGAGGGGLPLIISTGAAELFEIERSVGWLWKWGAGERAVILQCVSSYPTAADRATLGAIAVLRGRFAEMSIGYSDHTGETVTGALAVACGACLLEKHLTLDRGAAGPDHAASLEPMEMAEYVRQAELGFKMRGAFAKTVLPEEKGVREQTRQSVAARVDLKAGMVVEREMVCVKRPGTGIPAAELESVVGKKLVRDVGADRVMRWEDFGGEGVTR